MTRLTYIFIVLTLFFSPFAYASVGKVSLLKGEASLQRLTQTLELQNGSTVEEKDTIITAKDSQLQLVFEDKTVITLGSESEFKIEEYLNDASKPKAKFKFNQGSFKTITGQIGKTAPDNFTMETKTATIGIRGTTVQGTTSSKGDSIACLSGTITVRLLGSNRVVVVPAGKVTFVQPGKEPTPPANIQPGNTGGENGNPPTQSNSEKSNNVEQTTSEVNNQSNNNALSTKVQQSIEENTQVYKGFIATSYQNDYLSLFSQETSKTYAHTFTSHGMVADGGVFDITASMYTLDIGDATYTSLGTQTISIDTAPAGVIVNNTDFFYTSNAIPLADVTMQVDGSPVTITGAMQTIWRDTQNEVVIAKATYNDGDVFSRVLLAGPMSTSLVNSDLLYYRDHESLYSDPSLVTNNTDIDRTALVINTSNKKALSLWIDGSYSDGYNIGIGIGSLKNSNKPSLTMERYITTYDSDGMNTNNVVEVLGGALYGTNNQAVGLLGVATNIAQYYDEDEEEYLYPKTYTISSAIALRNTSENYTIPTSSYATSQTLTGRVISQSIYDGSATVHDDLSILINKASGKVSVSSDLADFAISNANSAFIHDDYFAAFSTMNVGGVTLMKDYFMAISYDSAEDDYVSWGYWGKTNYDSESNPAITNASTPFSTWVAGIKTPASFLSAMSTNNTTYNYAGRVIGSVIESGCVGYILNDASNAINLNINFSTSSIGGSMGFNTNLGGSWSSTITGTSLTAATSSFSANLTGSSTGSLNGNFYGPNANSVAGGFNLAQGGNKAVGSFKAVASVTPQIPGP